MLYPNHPRSISTAKFIYIFLVRFIVHSSNRGNLSTIWSQHETNKTTCKFKLSQLTREFEQNWTSRSSRSMPSCQRSVMNIHKGLQIKLSNTNQKSEHGWNMVYKTTRNMCIGTPRRLHKLKMGRMTWVCLDGEEKQRLYAWQIWHIPTLCVCTWLYNPTFHGHIKSLHYCFSSEYISLLDKESPLLTKKWYTVLPLFLAQWMLPFIFLNIVHIYIYIYKYIAHIYIYKYIYVYIYIYEYITTRKYKLNIK